MKPVLYRYRDSESVIKAMEGYTPGEGWTPLYDQQAAIDAAIAATLELAVKVCEELSTAEECATAIRALKEKP